MKCIICKEEKVDSEFTDEHVFADSIGGTLILSNVCKDCNDKLGRHIDAKLVNHLLIQFVRLTLKIPSKSGKVPNPLENGVLRSDPDQQVKYFFDNTGVPQELYMVPKVAKTTREDGSEEVHMVIDVKDRDKLPTMINKMLRRKGLPEISAEEIEKHIKTSTDHTPTMEISRSIDLVDYKRGILKIAYELAYYWLGENYLNDPVGEEIRRCITDYTNKEWFKKYKIRETINLTGKKPMLQLWTDETSSHISFVKASDGKIVIYIRVFDVFEANIVVSEKADQYTPFTDRFISINSETGEIRESDLMSEFLRICQEDS